MSKCFITQNRRRGCSIKRLLYTIVHHPTQSLHPCRYLCTNCQ